MERENVLTHRSEVGLLAREIFEVTLSWTWICMYVVMANEAMLLQLLALGRSLKKYGG